MAWSRSEVGEACPDIVSESSGCMHTTALYAFEPPLVVLCFLGLKAEMYVRACVDNSVCFRVPLGRFKATSMRIQTKQ
jgi:hypothetical protein